MWDWLANMAGTVTALRTQKRRKDRVSVFLDEEYAFSVQRILAVELRIGQLLTDEEIEGMRRRDQGEQGYERALRYLSYRPRSEVEMRRYLQRKELDEEAIGRVLSRLGDARLLGDLDFARFWVDNRETFRPRGRFALRSELRAKGVSNEIIETAIADVDEEASAMRAAERRVRALSGLDERAFRRRLLAYLQRRGFGYAVSRRVVDCLWRKVETGRETLD